jgi:uncharacterized metal-binding protein YceD (DUF177 family)
MSKNREFEIAYVGLKPGIHNYSYEITDSFFKNFAEQEFSNSQLKVNLSLDKKSDTFLIKMDVDGVVTTTCDRCCEDMVLRIWDDYTMVVKLVDTDIAEALDEEDPEIVHFPRSESLMDVSAWIYEFIILSLPIQKVHDTDENGKSACNPEVLKLIANANDIHELEQKPLTAFQEQLQKIKINNDAKS